MRDKPVIIVTGAAGSIGSAIVRRFSKQGYVIVLVDKDVEGLKIIGNWLLQERVENLIIEADLEDTAVLQQLVSDAAAKFERIDVLVNNATWRTRETLRTISVEDWERAIKVSLTAPAFLIKYAAAVMEKNNTRGSIINISSIQSFFAGGTSAAYTVSKGGLESLTYEASVLYGPKGIRVNTINPGAVNTALARDIVSEQKKEISDVFTEAMKDNTPLRRIAEPEEIANIVFWLSSPESSFITGATIVADGGFMHNLHSYSLKKLQFPQQF